MTCELLTFAQSSIHFNTDTDTPVQLWHESGREVVKTEMTPDELSDLKPYLIDVTKRTFNYGDEVDDCPIYGVLAPSLEHAKAWIYNQMFAYEVEAETIQDIYDWAEENIDEEMPDFVNCGDIWYSVDNIREIPKSDFDVMEKYCLFRFKNFWN